MGCRELGVNHAGVAVKSTFCLHCPPQAGPYRIHNNNALNSGTRTPDLTFHKVHKNVNRIENGSVDLSIDYNIIEERETRWLLIKDTFRTLVCEPSLVITRLQSPLPCQYPPPASEFVTIHSWPWWKKNWGPSIPASTGSCGFQLSKIHNRIHSFCTGKAISETCDSSPDLETLLNDFSLINYCRYLSHTHHSYGQVNRPHS